MTKRLISAPSTPVLTTQEVKDHLHISNSSEDTYLGLLVTAATLKAEQFLNRKLITQTWEVYLDSFPPPNFYDNSIETLKGGTILMPYPRLLSVVSIQYQDTNNATQTLDPSKYQIDLKSEPARIAPAADVGAWPSTKIYQLNSVTIRFTCGYGPASSDVPEDVREAIRVIIGDFYTNRDQNDLVNSKMSSTAELLLYPYRNFYLGCDYE